MEGKRYLYHMAPFEGIRRNEEGKDVLYPRNVLKEKFPDLYEVTGEKYITPLGDDERNKERASVPERLIPTLESAAWGDTLNLTAVNPQDLMDALEEVGFEPKKLKFYQIDPAVLDPKLATIYLYREDVSDKEGPEQYADFDPEKLHEHTVIPERTRLHYRQKFEEGVRPLLFVGVPHILYKGHLDVSDIEQFPVIEVFGTGDGDSDTSK